MQFSLFGQKSRPLIGVDISSSAVKMLELADGGGGALRVERYAVTPLPKETVVDGSLVKPEAVSDALRETWRVLDTRTKDIVLALPASAVTAKKIILPRDTPEADIEIQAITEANQIVSFPIEDVALDFQILGGSPRNPEDSEVLVVVSRKDRIEERIAAAEAAGLRTAVMDVDTYATLRAFEQIAFQLPEDGHNLTVAMIDIGATTTHVNVLHDNLPVYQREHPFGGQILTQEIARRFDMSTEEAEDAKRKGLLPESYESEVLRPFLDAVSVEIQRALQFFFSSTQFQSVDQILLAGGCSAIPSLDEVVFSKMQTSTVLANPFSKMAVSSHVKARQLAIDAPALFVACGLALRRFDPE